MNRQYLIFTFCVLTSTTILAQDENNPDSLPVNADEQPPTSPAPDALPQDPDTVPPSDVAEELVERAQPNPTLRRINEVLKHLKLFDREGEVIKFSDDEASINGLYLEQNTGRPQGGVLILHDIEQHAHWPNTIGPLREYLPDYGWNTLSLFFDGYIMPPLPEIQSPKKEESSSNNNESIANNENETEVAETESPPDLLDEEAETDLEDGVEDQNFDSELNNNDELDNIAADFQPFPVPEEEPNESDSEEDNTSSPEAFIEAMTERVEGGLRQLNTLGQFNLVVVAHGLSANWAANTLLRRFEQNPGARGYALVLVDAQQSRYPKFDLNNTVALFNIPILDIYTSQDDHQEQLAKRRKNAIVREQKANYIQIRLPSIETSNNSKQNMITRRVRGWLKTHAAGEEVNVAEKNY